jgi:hypothetical protein
MKPPIGSQVELAWNRLVDLSNQLGERDSNTTLREALSGITFSDLGGFSLDRRV